MNSSPVMARARSATWAVGHHVASITSSRPTASSASARGAIEEGGRLRPVHAGHVLDVAAERRDVVVEGSETGHVAHAHPARREPLRDVEHGVRAAGHPRDREMRHQDDEARPVIERRIVPNPGAADERGCDR